MKAQIKKRNIGKEIEQSLKEAIRYMKKETKKEKLLRSRRKAKAKIKVGKIPKGQTHKSKKTYNRKKHLNPEDNSPLLIRKEKEKTFINRILGLMFGFNV